MTPYRTSEVARAEVKPDGSPLLSLDVSARRGRDGAPGMDGGDGYHSGADGAPGGDAGPAEPGVGAGDVAIALRSMDGGSVVIDGEIRRSDGAVQKVETTVSVDRPGDVVLLARGGHGGAGGRGGRGGAGARGRAGSDATRHSNGGDGGRGGDGGDGGDGTSGAPGGAGGRIAVHVAEHDTHLLMLVSHAENGGKGGAVGVNGVGGNGGSGGSGGSSYSWTTSSSHTDSQGRTSTTTHHHRNPGGSDGPRGHDGRDGRARLDAGRRGRDGSYEIRVGAHGAIKTYTSRFDLSLVRFSHENENRDGIYEPEERVVVSRVVVKNTGGMPTPAQRAVAIYLAESAWVSSEKKTIVLPRALAPGDEMELPGELGFAIGVYRPEGPTDPLASEGKIDLDAWIPDVRRAFGGFDSGCAPGCSQFVVSFPVEASPIDGLYSLAAGETARLSFRIKNVSKKAFGSKSELARAIMFRLALHQSEVRADRVEFRNGSGALVSLDAGYADAIARLEPGAEHLVQGTLTFGESVTPYTAARLRLALSLGRIQAGDDLRVVQFRELLVRVAERYRPNPAAHVLLVVQNRTTRDEVEAWRSVASSFGHEVAVWDLSLEGHFDLDEPIAGGALSAQFAGKAIVVLGAVFDTARGEERAYRHIASDEAQRFAAGGGRMVLLGKPPRSEWALLPVSRDGGAASHDHLGGLDAMVELAGKLELGAASEFRLMRSYMFYPPREEQLAKLARELADELDERFPTRRHLVVHAFDGTITEHGFTTRARFGTLRVERMLDVGVRGLAPIAADDEAIHDGSAIAEHLGPLALAWALSAGHRARMIARDAARETAPLLGTGGASDEAEDGGESGDARVEDAVAAPLGFLGARIPAHPLPWIRWWNALDVAVEIHDAASRPRLAPPGEIDGRDAALPKLSAIVTTELGDGAIDPLSALGSAILETIAIARATAWGFVSFWELIPPFLFFLRHPRLYFRVRALTTSLFDRAFPSGDAEASRRRKLASKRLGTVERSVVAAVRAELGPPFGNTNGGQRIVEWLGTPMVARGARTAASPHSPVLSSVEHAEFLAARAKQDRAREKLERQHTADRGRRIVR